MVISAVESTSIALLAQLSGLLDPLRAFSKTKPVWGTCAGAILLAQEVKDAKRGGQELLGCVSITIVRNGWGSQVQFLCSDLLTSELLNDCLHRWNLSRLDLV